MSTQVFLYVSDMRKSPIHEVLPVFSPFRNSGDTFWKTHTFAPSEVHTSTHLTTYYNILSRFMYVKPSTSTNINKPLKAQAAPLTATVSAKSFPSKHAHCEIYDESPITITPIGPQPQSPITLLLLNGNGNGLVLVLVSIIT